MKQETIKLELIEWLARLDIQPLPVEKAARLVIETLRPLRG